MPCQHLSRLLILIFTTAAFTLTGCSYIPWFGDDTNEDDLAFEQEFEDTDPGGDQAAGAYEDDAFFEEESRGNQGGSGGGSGFEDTSGGFASVNQGVDARELRSDVETL
ncbi:MAG: hypothetical protein ACE5ER_12125, partial [Nitrospinaceae bacterium]